MAKPSEILATLREAGLSPQDSANVYALRSQLDTTKGITDAMREKAFLDSFGDDVPVYLEDAEVEAPLPTFATILSKLKIENDDKDMNGGRSAIEKFIDDFPKKQKAWKKTIENDPSFGERGWEFVKDAWKQASLDKMNADIKSGIKRTLDEGDNVLSLPIFGDIDMGDAGKTASKYGMMLTKFFRPRAYEAWERGEDPSAKDQVGDFIESGLMAIPAGQYVGKASRVLSKIPKAGQYAQKALANKYVSNVLGNAVAPFASEAMDAAMRGEDDSNTQRQDFSLGDALLGTLINLGVNFGLAQKAGQFGRVGEGELMRSQNGVIKRVREQIGNFGKSRAERGLGPALPSEVSKRIGVLPSSILNKGLDVAGSAAPTLLVNRYGKEKDANIGAAAFNLVGLEGVDPLKSIKELRNDEYKEMQNRKTKKEVEGVKASRILDLDARDVKYLDAVANDPSIVQFGYAPNNDDFKLWLLERGHKLLANTGAHRPMWEVK